MHIWVLKPHSFLPDETHVANLLRAVTELVALDRVVSETIMKELCYCVRRADMAVPWYALSTVAVFVAVGDVNDLSPGMITLKNEASAF